MKTLELSTEDFRRLATNIVELCSEYMSTLDGRSVFPRVTGLESELFFDLDLPEDGMGDQAFAALIEVIKNSRVQNGRFFGYVQGSAEAIAALGDLLSSILNQNITAWRSSPAGVTIERTVVRWLSEVVSCSGFVGTLTRWRLWSARCDCNARKVRRTSSGGFNCSRSAQMVVPAARLRVSALSRCRGGS